MSIILPPLSKMTYSENKVRYERNYTINESSLFTQSGNETVPTYFTFDDKKSKITHILVRVINKVMHLFGTKTISQNNLSNCLKHADAMFLNKVDFSIDELISAKKIIVEIKSSEKFGKYLNSGKGKKDKELIEALLNKISLKLKTQIRKDLGLYLINGHIEETKFEESILGAKEFADKDNKYDLNDSKTVDALRRDVERSYVSYNVDTSSQIIQSFEKIKGVSSDITWKDCALAILTGGNHNIAAASIVASIFPSNFVESSGNDYGIIFNPYSVEKDVIHLDDTKQTITLEISKQVRDQNNNIYGQLKIFVTTKIEFKSIDEVYLKTVDIRVAFYKQDGNILKESSMILT